MMLLHWPCFTWKFFMIWFHKIPKLLFQKKPWFPRNICTEHWRKPSIFTAFLEIFLYPKNNESVEYVFLIVLFIYFQGKSKVFLMDPVNLFVSKFYFTLFLLFYFLKLNHYFSVCENLPNSWCHFGKQKSVFLQILHQSPVPSNIILIYIFTSNIIAFVQKKTIQVKFSGRNSSNSSCQFWNKMSIPLQILHHSSLSWHITLV